MKTVIECKKLGKKYKDIVVFKNLQFKVEEGEFVAIVGKSGGGKTTLLNILGLIDTQTEGDLDVWGQTNIDPKSKTSMLLRRNRIGYLFQNYGLVDDESVWWNLSLALEYKKFSKKKKKEKILELLNEFNMGDLFDKKVCQLSGGEQQRIAIIRLILQDCDLILADEPTGSLDLENRDYVIQKLIELNDKGKTIILVTHDPYVAGKCSKIIRINDINMEK